MTYTIPLRKVEGVVGSYEWQGKKDVFPARLAYLRDVPLAAGTVTTPWRLFQNARAKIPQLVLSDMYRTPVDSMIARKQKSGVQPPGSSGHNFGVSMDVAIDMTLQRSGLAYPNLVETLASCGITPFNRNNKSASGFEAWHFNLLNLDIVRAGTKGADVEEWITSTYGEQLYVGEQDWTSIQKALSIYGWYAKEAIDGIPGPKTIGALSLFRDMMKVYPRGKGLDLTRPERRALQAVLAVVAQNS